MKQFVFPPLLLLSFLLCFFNSACEFVERCREPESDDFIIWIGEFNQDNVVDWGVINNGIDRRITFWFDEYTEENGQVRGHRISDICALNPITVEALLFVNENNRPFETCDFKVLLYYPSVPPSEKILYSEGTRASASDQGLKYTSFMSMKCPSEYQVTPSSSWVEIGIQVEMKTYGDLKTDLDYFSEHYQMVKIYSDYTDY